LSAASHHRWSNAAAHSETNENRRESTIMHNHHEGLPAAATVEQAVILAQLQILRRIERQRNLH
jgi:hypothetical protein